jgi:hypothetical protein
MTGWEYGGWTAGKALRGLLLEQRRSGWWPVQLPFLGPPVGVTYYAVVECGLYGIEESSGESAVRFRINAESVIVVT